MIFIINEKTIHINEVPNAHGLVPRLIEHIEQNPIETVEISKLDLSDSEWRKIFVALEKKNTLKLMHLPDFKLMDNDDLPNLGQLMAEQDYFSYIDSTFKFKKELSVFSIHMESNLTNVLTYFRKILSSNEITDLILSQIRITKNEIVELFDITNLNKLTLASCGFSEGALDKLCISLDKSQLQSLSLSGSKIGYSGAKILAHHIEKSKTVKHLDLSDCGINTIYDVVPKTHTLTYRTGWDDSTNIEYTADVQIDPHSRFLESLLRSNLITLNLSQNPLSSIRFFLFEKKRQEDQYNGDDWSPSYYTKVYTREFVKEVPYSIFSWLQDICSLNDQLGINNFLIALKNNPFLTELNICGTQLPISQIRALKKTNVTSMIVIAGTQQNISSFKIATLLSQEMQNFLGQPLGAPPPYSPAQNQLAAPNPK